MSGGALEQLPGRTTLYCGDCLDMLDGLAENSVDAVVTDPPYHLTSIVKRFGGKNAVLAKHGTDGLYARQSRGFMGKQWDGGDIAFQAELWAKVLRVLKPGGHIVAFSGTRTYHRMACAIEDAGFEIRDSLMWHYGSGFPKSLNVSKAIDKARKDVDDVRVVCRALRAAMDRRGLKSGDLTEHFDGCHSRLIDHWAARDTDSQPSLPTPLQWAKLVNMFPEMAEFSAEADRLNARKGEFGEDWKVREITGNVEQWRDRSNYALTSRDGLRRDIAASDLASEWEGWGTALKPATEIICLARKPLSENTVAANVLKWGTGALNIDGCRIPTNDKLGGGGEKAETLGKFTNDGWRGPWMDDPETSAAFAARVRANVEKSQTLGRWPANICHDGSEEVIAAFAESNGQQRLVKGTEPSECHNGVYSGPRSRQGIEYVPRGDSGSAARFFYSAKADVQDRLGSKHPTVKPIDLMRWLARLVTPPKGVCLDPFAGTGTTAEAAFLEGFSSILIERESEYQADIRRRMSLVMGGEDERRFAAAKARNEGKPVDAGPLFGGTINTGGADGFTECSQTRSRPDRIEEIAS